MFNIIVEKSDMNIIDIDFFLFQCQTIIDSGSICIYAERAGRNGFWHPQCFTCVQCKEFLVNLIYFHKDGLLYCGRHHAELYKPRCTACDEVCRTD